MIEKVETDNKGKNMYIMNQYTYSRILLYLDIFKQVCLNEETEKQLEILINSLRRS